MSFNNDQNNESFANLPNSKKMGFFSAMLVVVGSSIGAGIFFKAGSVLNNSQDSIIFAMFCWICAGFAVVSMALALIEIGSARNDNLSIIGWSQTFNSRSTFKACKNFMCYVYVPLTYFFMPLYTIVSIQDGVSALIPNYNGFGTSADWSIVMTISIVISLYFIIVNSYSSKVGNVQNWIITSVKFFPLLFAAILGFVVLGINGGNIANPEYTPGFKPVDSNNIENFFSFSNLSPGFGMFIAIGAIFFAYDGFYVTAGIQSEIKEPKKTPWAILVGLSIVTIIYLVIAISMSVGSTDGNPFGFQEFLVKHNLNWLYATFQILIGVGILGIINGFALWTPRLFEDLIKENELPFSVNFVTKITTKKAKVGMLYNIAITLPLMIIFCMVGGLGYVNTSGYSSTYGSGLPELYSFADLMANWTSVISFAFILFSIIGAYKNRKINQVKVQEFKFFKPMAICSIITLLPPIFFTFFGPIADFFMLFLIPNNHPDFLSNCLVPRVMSVVVLLLFLFLMYVPTLFEDYHLKKKYGSIEKGEIAKMEKMSLKTNIPLENLLLAKVLSTKKQNLNDEQKKILLVESLSDLNDYEIN